MKIPFIDTALPILPQFYALSGPIFTPIPSALFLSYHMFTQFGEPKWIAIAIGVGSFFGFEACGGACVAAVLKLHHQKRYDADFFVCLIGILAYTISPTIVLMFGGGPILFAFLAALAVFAGNTYFALVAQDKDLDSKLRLDIKAKELANKGKRLDVKLIKLQNTDPVQKVYNKLYTCKWCGEEFDNPRRYAVHEGRYCKDKPKE